MAGYQAKSNSGNDSKSNKNDNNKNVSNPSIGNPNPPLKDNLKQKGASAAMQAVGVPKPIADFGAKQAANGNLGKKMNPAQLAKQHDSSKRKDGDVSDSNTSDEGKKASNAKNKLGEAKDSINNFKNAQDEGSQIKVVISFVKMMVALAPLIVILLPFFIIFMVLISVQSIFGDVNDVDNMNKINPISASVGNEGSSNGTRGDYYAPVQNINNLSFGSVSSTAGCNNEVSHDVSNIPEGTLLYAGLDGKAEFIQISCGDELYSYGNEVRITASDGTYIIYGHLKQFADGVQTEITKTCPKKDDAPPCPSSSCSDLNVKTVDTKDVKAGDVIGQVGNTGNSTNTHLHVEIHKPNTRNCVVDPWASFGLR